MSNNGIAWLGALLVFGLLVKDRLFPSTGGTKPPPVNPPPVNPPPVKPPPVNPPPAGFFLTIETTGSGNVTKDPYKVRYAMGEKVTLEATPGNFNYVELWTVNNVWRGAGMSITVDMVEDTMVKCRFGSFDPNE